ncbi:hypothetical protein BUALT_Bualt09G0061700 [Buddleja alternifolia]|uniref:Uncharacterized protein n=1 Tax=Buddleja alternifolia TaxID=168488 RepID=A0AAV6WZQ2_9LAMI|nr:hypothetical protein BUALT_Bualt09G0061700 [Buddleja alternifolia]
MGLLTNRVERSEIKAGDHIYSYRAVFAYSHHGLGLESGIYVLFRLSTERFGFPPDGNLKEMPHNSRDGGESLLEMAQDSSDSNKLVRILMLVDLLNWFWEESETGQCIFERVLVSVIDSTMKKYADNLIYAIDGLSARVSQLETRTHNLENSVDDMKVSLGNNHGSIDGK